MDENTGATHAYLRLLINKLEVVDGDLNVSTEEGITISYKNSVGSTVRSHDQAISVVDWVSSAHAPIPGKTRTPHPTRTSSRASIHHVRPLSTRLPAGNLCPPRVGCHILPCHNPANPPHPVAFKRRQPDLGCSSFVLLHFDR